MNADLNITPRGSSFTAVVVAKIGEKYHEIVERMPVTASRETSFQLAGKYWFSRKTGKRIRGVGYIKGY